MNAQPSLFDSAPTTPEEKQQKHRLDTVAHKDELARVLKDGTAPKLVLQYVAQNEGLIVLEELAVWVRQRKHCGMDTPRKMLSVLYLEGYIFKSKGKKRGTFNVNLTEKGKDV